MAASHRSSRCLRLLWAGAWLASGVMAAAQGSAPYPAAVAARFPAPAAAYPTPGLQPGRETWTDNAELAAALRTLAGSGAAELMPLGRTDGAAELLALRFSRGAGRPVALLVAQQHGNEPAGAEALLAVAMQLGNPSHPLAAVLDQLDVVLVPRANPDGASLSRRGNAAGLDVNRDHLLLRTREAGVLAQLVARLRPVLFVDLHEHLAVGRVMRQAGAVKAHDLLTQYATAPNLPPALSELAERDFRQPMLKALDAAGISHDWYHTTLRGAEGLHLTMGGVQPGLARNAGGLKNMVSMLLESRGLDLGRTHALRRVQAHVVAVESLLRSAAAQAPALQAKLDEIGRTVAGLACRGDLVLDAAPTTRRREILAFDAQTGEPRTLLVDWDDALQLRTLGTRPRPCGYWLAADATEAVERLRRWGVDVQVLAEPKTLQAEAYRETARVAGESGDAPESSTDSAPPQRVTVALVPGRLEAAAGSHYVPLAQPLAHLVAAALEPDSNHSWFTQRVLPRLDAVQRVTSAP